MAGAKRRSGGKRLGSGRKAGVPNKATAEIKALAQMHGPEAVERLAHLMVNAESEQAQVAACRELLDRAYGKPSQAIVGADDEPPVKNVLEVSWVDRPPRETREECLARREREMEAGRTADV